ncbi:MAG: ATM1-type heavy metal exporter [Alphaproteobacteria bacterium MarineAlpha4_Bin2]|nr:MAG: ATM1-type heavy metal exporter [Alphaproteobacteria bacterium MarineAlpha4_Bin2]
MTSTQGTSGLPPRARHIHWRTLRTTLPYVWPRADWNIRSRVVFALAALISAKITNVYVPIIYRDVVDKLDGLTSAVIVLPLALLLGYGGARILGAAFEQLREALFARVTYRAMRRAAMNVFHHLHSLSLRFHLERRTGGLSRVIERGVKGIEFVLSFTIFNILPTTLEILIVCGILWSFFDFWFALVTFVTIGLYIAYTLILTEWRIKFRRMMNERDTEANSRAIDSLLNYETVKYFCNEVHEERRFDASLQGYEDAAVFSTVSLSAVNVGQGVIISIGLVILMIMAGNGVVAGEMTLGDFVLVNTYLIQLYLPLNFLGFVYRTIRQSLTDMEDMFGLLTVPMEISDRQEAEALSVKKGEIIFDHVDFFYEKRRPILRDVSFVVPPGKTVAIVGPSGAGKSTISRLLFRFYDVTGGAIHVDGHDIRAVTQFSLRDAIGIVPQDTVLFNDTIYYNILYGRTDATREEVEAAAKLSRIHDFVVELADGYESMVGERGLKLSGGEKQRIAIARTILKRPTILLLDEATSALDTYTEREIQDSLQEVSRDRTTLIIAHRLSTVVQADQIIVLDKGSIVERGTHADLLDIGGRYAQMWREQQKAGEELTINEA